MVVGTLNRIKVNTLERGIKWLEATSLILTTCTDTSDPSSKGDYNLCMPNHILYLLKHKYSYAAKSYSLGKPNPIHGEKIREYFKTQDREINNNNILFVGDSIHTDIQLAEEQGFQSCLVLSGNTKSSNINNYVIQPDYVVKDLWSVNKTLQQQVNNSQQKSDLTQCTDGY